MNKTFALAATLAAGIALAPIAGEAAVVTFDDEVVNGGTVSYAGGAAPLVGSNILLDRIRYPSTGSTFSCNTCDLDFTTGAHPGTIGSFPGVLDSWSGGGSLTITGTAGTPVPSPNGPTLLSGSFVGNVVATESPLSGFVNITGFFDGTLDPVLASFLGVPQAGDGSLTEITLGISKGLIGTGTAFTTTSTDADVNFSPVPVPAALPLMLTALAGLGLIGRRRMQADA